MLRRVHGGPGVGFETAGRRTGLQVEVGALVVAACARGPRRGLRDGGGRRTGLPMCTGTRAWPRQQAPHWAVSRGGRACFCGTCTETPGVGLETAGVARGCRGLRVEVGAVVLFRVIALSVLVVARTNARHPGRGPRGTLLCWRAGLEASLSTPKATSKGRFSATQRRMEVFIPPSRLPGLKHLALLAASTHPHCNRVACLNLEFT